MMLFLMPLVVAQTVVTTNITYHNNQSHDTNSFNGIVIASLTNQTLFNFSRSPIDTAPYCLIVNHRTNETLLNTTWIENQCIANINLTVGESYRFSTGANSTSYRVTFNNTMSTFPGLPFARIPFFNLLFGCSGNLCGDSFPTTVYSITNFTLGQTIENLTIFYNATTYETSLENFIGNFTIGGSTISSVELIYGGTIYTGTITASGGDNYLFSRAIDIPLGASSNLWNWNVTYANGSEQELPTYAQTVSLINLSICGGAPQNTQYINITFKNETVGQERVSATLGSSWEYYLGSGSVTKTLSYSSSTETPMYSFCFSPTTRNISVTPSVTYASSVHQQRNYNPGILALSPIVKNVTLYLLPNTDGSFVSFQVVSAAFQPIADATVNVSSATYGAIEQAQTSDSGLVTFFLNPNVQYTVCASKASYGQFCTTDFFTQSSYSISLGQGSTGNQSYDYTRGVTYSILPRFGTLTNGTYYNFSFDFSSTYWDATSFGFYLRNASGFALASTSKSGSSGIVSYNMSTGNNGTIIMDAWYLTNGTYTNLSRSWAVLTIYDTGYSISNFFTRLSTYLNDETDSDGLFGLKNTSGGNFGMALVVFIIIFGSAGFVSFKYGLSSPFAVMFFIAGFVYLFDWVLGLVPTTGSGVHIATIVTFLILVGVGIREWLR